MVAGVRCTERFHPTENRPIFFIPKICHPEAHRTANRTQPHSSATTVSKTSQPSPLRPARHIRRRRLIQSAIYLGPRTDRRNLDGCASIVPTHITRGRSVRPTPFSTFCIRPQRRWATDSYDPPTHRATRSVRHCRSEENGAEITFLPNVVVGSSMALTPQHRLRGGADSGVASHA